MMRQEDAHLLETVEGSYHSTIERLREDYFEKNKEEQTILEEKTAKYPLRERMGGEKEKLLQLQELEKGAKEEEVKCALHHKLHLGREDLPVVSKLIITERKKRAIDMTWLSGQ